MAKLSKVTLSTLVVAATVGASLALPTGNAIAVTPRAVSVDHLAITPVAITQGLNHPTSVASAGDTRIFVTEQDGRIRVVDGGQLRARAFLNVSGIVNSSGDEQGLLGLAFSPDFASNKRFFFTYNDGSGAIVLAKALAVSAHSNVARRGSVRVMLRVPHPNATNHNGGSLTFGTNGLLYFGTGDGGGAGDPGRTAQSFGNLLGKILRLNVDRNCGAKRYCVPGTNPYVHSPSMKKRLIWARGVRNPWKMTTDPATSMIWIADVGQNKYEEIDAVRQGTTGRDFGWSCLEGNASYNGDQCARVANYVAPLTTLCHQDEVSGCPSSGSGESITGGYVYRGSAQPLMYGTYLFADFIVGNLYAYRDGQRAKVGHLGTVTSFGRMASGELVAVTYSGGLYRMQASQV